MTNNAEFRSTHHTARRNARSPERLRGPSGLYPAVFGGDLCRERAALSWATT